MSDCTTFYIAFTSNEYFSSSPLAHNTTAFATTTAPQLWKKKHWKLFYTQDELQYYVIELAGTQGVRHRSVTHNKQKEPGYTQRQKLFDVIYPFDALRYEIHSAFSKEEYNVCNNNCRQCVLHAVKHFLVPLFPVINMTWFAEETLLGLASNDLNMSLFSSSSLGNCSLYPNLSVLLKNIITVDDDDVTPQQKQQQLAAEIEATMPPLPQSVKKVCDIPTEVRVALRLLALNCPFLSSE
ncbi:hypothetical protein BDA99DRAFT_562427 [Phascolomyces articulosus]|uniref:Uncharacterized protein n=1 Tax=Phascolomyces articulosus TaxID=60185 RepID=A0AAD5PAZ8_9FUNG|nr:hypothetical protein BDA99DRAFT_562427 [Phascolomyces articulosus]